MARSATIAILLFLPGILFETAAGQTCDFAVPATIVDAQTGMFIPSITPAMLHAKLGKNFFPAKSVQRIENFRVLLLIDSSASMKSGDAFSNPGRAAEETRKVTEGELSSIPAGVQVGFGIFNDQIVFAEEFTSDSGKLKQMIVESTARLKRPGHGYTALSDALQQSVAQFGSIHPGDTVLVLTDGGDNVSKASQRDFARHFARQGVRVFVLLVGDHSPAQPEEIGGINAMFDVAERSGGSVHIVPAQNAFWGDKKKSLAERSSLIRFLKEQVLSAYLLHFSIPSPQGEQKWILALDPAANGNRKMAAGYPSHVEPCTLNTAIR